MNLCSRCRVPDLPLEKTAAVRGSWFIRLNGRGFTDAQIGAMAGMHENSVGRIRRRYREQVSA